MSVRESTERVGSGRTAAADVSTGADDTRQRLRPVVVVTAAGVPGAERDERRLLPVAALVGERAAVGEDAPVDLGAERREESGDGREPGPVLANPAARDRAEQPHGVGVARVVEDDPRRALLDQTAGVQHADAIAHLRDHRQVVADEQHARPEREPAARRSGRAPRPRPSRRARWWARPGSAAPAATRAPSRSRRAAASLPTAGADTAASRDRGRRSGPCGASRACARRASSLDAPPISKTSATCRPTRIEGFSADPGFW